MSHAALQAIIPASTLSDPISETGQLWLGTAMGVVMRSDDPAADPPWRYFYGA
jgi:hypothetical protein